MDPSTFPNDENKNRVFSQSGIQHRYPENNLGSRPAAAGNFNFLPEVGAYNRVPPLNPNYQDSISQYNIQQLESDLSRLNVRNASDYSLYGAGGVGSGAGFDLNLKNQMGINLPSYSDPQTHYNMDNYVHLLRSPLPSHASSVTAGQLGFGQNYETLGDPQNSGASSSTLGDLNALSDYQIYNSRAFSATAMGYLPGGNRNRSRYGGNLLNQLNPLTRSNSSLSANSVATMLSERSDRQARPRFNRLGVSSASLDEYLGQILMMAKDQFGCRFLQNKFDEGRPENIHLIFNEVKDAICELMTDQFGNYMVQKLFEVCNEDQISQLLFITVNDEWKFKDICIDMHGTRAVQKLMEHLKTSTQKTIFVSVLRRITVALTKSMNGHHVIQNCMKFFSVEDNKSILSVVADNCLDIATDKSGCCVLQQCVNSANGEPKERLISEITSNALSLAEHPYGNYVVQFVLGLGFVQYTEEILTQLKGHFVSLSTNKYGSNVVEKCLRESASDQVQRIIEELVTSPNFLRVLQDPYGNYVAQCAITTAKGALRSKLHDQILVFYPFLHSHPHGKRVLARAKISSKMRL